MDTETLEATAKALVADHKGILAADESTGTATKRFQGIGIERVFLIHSPRVEKIQVQRRGNVRRAKLYYLREKVGKKARVRAVQRRDKLVSTDGAAETVAEPE
ncbi:MAG: 50S ribosomal protein L19, partial [Thermoplasmatota archaeon]